MQTTVCTLHNANIQVLLIYKKNIYNKIDQWLLGKTLEFWQTKLAFNNYCTVVVEVNTTTTSTFYYYFKRC